MRSAGRRAALVLLTLAVAAVAVAPLAGAQVAGAPARYYVDSALGNDANPGTSMVAPWRSLAKVQAQPFAPGSIVLFKRGGDWTGKLDVKVSGSPDNPILISAYGVGAPPRIHHGGCIDLLGSNLIVQYLHVDACNWAGISSSGANNVIRESYLSNNVAGVYLRQASTGNRVVNSVLRDNNRMSVATPTPANDDSGAWGVLLRGDDAEIAYNVITGSDGYSYDYVRDGAAIEIYGGRNNRIHHNLATDNNMFSELGHSRSASNVFAYNVVVSNLERGGFLTTRGANSSYGPVVGTELYNNSVLLKGALSEGIVCHAGCSPQILTMRNNVIQAVRKAGYADNPFDDGNGVYFGGRIQFVLGPGSIVAPPQFADPAAGDLRLLDTSPGVDAGDNSAPRFPTDLDRKPVPLDGNGDGHAVVDVGAYERG